MEELRAEPRNHLVYYLRVFEQDGQTLFGHVVDVSRNGMLITSDRAVSTQSKYLLAIEDINQLDTLETLEFEAECRWCKEEAGLYDAGFRLLGAAPRLERMLADYV